MRDDYYVQDRRSAFRSLTKLYPYLRPHLSTLSIAILAMIVGAVIGILLPMFARIAIDRYIAVGDGAGLIRLIMLATGLFIVANLTTAIRARLMAKVGQDIIRAIRRDLFKKLQVLPVSWFDKIPVGKVVTRLTSDVDALSGTGEQCGCQYFDRNPAALWIPSCNDLVGLETRRLPWRFCPSWYMPCSSYPIGSTEQRMRSGSRPRWSMLIPRETISGVKVIQAFGAQEYFEDRFARDNASLLNASLYALRVYAYFWPLVDLNWFLSVGALLFFGGRWVLDGSTTVGTLIAFIGYSGQFFGPLRGLSQAYRIIQRGLAGAVRIHDIFSTPAEVDPSLPPMPQIKGHVQFKDITFGYSDDEMVLRNINLEAQPGQTIALVGHTGAGKTSIINLLCRFYQPQKGQILVDGHDIWERELSSYRQQVGLVLQEPFLFSGTLRDNLRFGAPDATDEELWAALETVGLKESFQQQKVTLDTLLTERGSNFSTGQRQLLSFARALLADPKILILDEATAHVDTVTEQRVQEALQKLLAGRTSFVIAHRLSTIRNADEIVVIGQGRILEQGNHESLMARKGEYWELVSAQDSIAG